MKVASTVFTVVTAFTLLHLSAMCAGEEIPLEQITVSAFRITTPLNQTTQSVDVIGREIVRRRPASFIEILDQVPGVHVDQAGVGGGLSNAYIRGSDPNHVLIIVDGVRMNDPMTSRGGGYDLSSLDVAILERVEVIRGGGSVLYGADAMGGVINVITRRIEGGAVSGSAFAALGTQGYQSAAASLSGGTDEMRMSVSASNLQDGVSHEGGELDLSSFVGSVVAQTTATDRKSVV